MKEIVLTQGKVALVDDEDYEYLNQWKWRAVCHSKKYWYAYRSFYAKYYKIDIAMHNLIMKTPDGLVCDHINHNGLDNRRENLRNCTCGENMFNRAPNGKIKFKGVTMAHSKSGKFQARICYKGQSIFIGHFGTAEEAAIAYDKKAKELFGEYAYLNYE